MAKYLVCQWISSVILLSLSIYRIDGTTVVNAVKKSPLSIAVIGAGPSGKKLFCPQISFSGTVI